MVVEPGEVPSVIVVGSPSVCDASPELESGASVSVAVSALDESSPPQAESAQERAVATMGEAKEDGAKRMGGLV
jgi:hypothetical protein